MYKPKIIAICGSTRKASSNLNLLHAIAGLTAENLELEIFTGIAQIPHFNPDQTIENTPAEVEDFRNRLRAADGILICTPEYAMGVPGTLKNAIDWTVSSCEFSHKPTALITASSLGQKGHQSLMETLKIIESDITEDTQMIISFVKTKVAPDNTIKDPATRDEVMKLMDAFRERIEIAKTLSQEA